MVLFWPIQQELDCINTSGLILGKIKFNGFKDEYGFFPTDDSISLSSTEKLSIDKRLAGLESGEFSIPMQDDE